MIPLTVVVLTQNEEASIERCLKSVNWVDEIILIDNSSDKTVQLAKKINPHVKVISDKKTEDFAALRNFGLEKAKNEWVLFLDADEEVSEELHLEIDSRFRGNDTEFNGFYIKRKDYFLGKWLKYGETGDIKHLKFGKKKTGIWRRRVHEVWDIEGNVGELHNSLLHYPHLTLAEFLSHINRWTTLDAQEFYDQGVRSSWLKIIAFPAGKFLRNYFYKLGFMDGMPGLLMSLMMSFHSFLTRAKLYMLQSKSELRAKN